MAPPELEKLTRLPSLPTVAIKIVKLFSEPDVGIPQVVKLLETDPALAGKLLETANSSRFGLRRRVGDLHRAVVLLGRKIVCSLALGFTLAETSMTRGPHAVHFRRFWMQSFTRALAAQRVVEQFNAGCRQEAFTIGLLSHIGQLAILKQMPDEFAFCAQEAAQRNVLLEDVEEELLGVSVQDLTIRLLERWQMPAHLVEAVREQSRPLSEAPAVRRECTLGGALQIADAVADFVSDQQRGLALARLYELLSELSQPQEPDVDSLIRIVRERLDENADLFQVDLAELGTPADLLSDALDQLMRLTISNVEEPQRDESQELVQENSRLKRRIAELTRESTIDALTSLFNRRSFDLQFQEKLVAAASRRQCIGLLFGDVDHFKRINDTHGHLVGDEVLRQVAGVLQRCVRTSDTVARYGGEEFVVLIDACEGETVGVLGERIRSQVEWAAIRIGGTEIPVTISLGGCFGRPAPGDPDFGERMVAAADCALYEAKERGRNRVEVVSLERGGSGVRRPARCEPVDVAV